VAFLHDGRIIEQGTPEEFQRSTNPMVQQFIDGRADGPLTE
jgi:phospholipid/cholesterol/gamma-HCH transport system ATP-binding protein